MTKSNNNLTQMNIWKKNLLAQKAEKDAKEEKFKKMMESGEMYDNMVYEAIGLITANVTKDTQSSYVLDKAKDGIVTISIPSALIITHDLRLYTAAVRVPRNPKTGKDYFFDSQQFKDEDQVKQFFKDVKAQLPEEVIFEEREARTFECPTEGGRAYDVKVEIDLNS